MNKHLCHGDYYDRIVFLCNRIKKSFINVFFSFDSVFIKLELFQQSSAMLSILNFKRFNWLAFALFYVNREIDRQTGGPNDDDDYNC